MKSIRYILLVSACCFISNEGKAEINLTFDVSNITLSNPTLYTHHTPVALKPISNFNSGIKLASVCSIIDGGCSGISFDVDYGLNPRKQCSDDGYLITSCPTGQIKVEQCPYDSSYYKYCQKDSASLCQEAGYTPSCSDGMVSDNSSICPENASYTKCKCDPCNGYTYTLAEAETEGWHILGEACNSCGNLKYMREINSCDGFLICNDGGEIGAEVCMQGTIKMFSTCKTLPKTCASGFWDLDNYYCDGALRCYVKE